MNGHPRRLGHGPLPDSGRPQAAGAISGNRGNCSTGWDRGSGRAGHPIPGAPSPGLSTPHALSLQTCLLFQHPDARAGSRSQAASRTLEQVSEAGMETMGDWGRGRGPINPLYCALRRLSLDLDSFGPVNGSFREKPLCLFLQIRLQLRKARQLTRNPESSSGL